MASPSRRPAKRRSPLYELRKQRLRRGWSLQDVAQRLIEVGARIGEANLGVNADMVGRWERGERLPRSPYPKVLALLYGCSAEELGLRWGATSEEKADNLERRAEALRSVSAVLGSAQGQTRLEVDLGPRAAEKPIRVGSNTVEVIQAAVAQCRRMDDLLGSRTALRLALLQRDLVARLLQASQGEEVRAKLLAVKGELSQFLGWLAFDLADHRSARTHFNEALQAAHEAEDDALGAYILGYLSILTIYGHEPQQGLAFVEAAQSRAQRSATVTTCSWLATVEAEAWASLHAGAATEQALERAETQLAKTKPEDDPGWIYHYDRAGLTSAAGTCYLLLDRPQDAARAMNEAINLSCMTEVREQAIHLTRLAMVSISEGEVEQACGLASKSINIAEETGSDRAVQRVAELRDRLEPWSETPPVKELEEQLAAVRN